MTTKRRKLTPVEKRKARNLCRQRDGDRCNDPNCGVSGEAYHKEKGRDFDLDHVDDDPYNNPSDGSNWQLLCHPCNVRKISKRGARRPFFSRYNEFKEEYAYARERADGRGDLRERDWRFDRLAGRSESLAKNQEAYPKFLRWLDILMHRKSVWPRKELIDALAKKAEVSQETIARYLDKESSVVSDYIIEFSKESGASVVRRRRPEERLEE